MLWQCPGSDGYRARRWLRCRQATSPGQGFSKDGQDFGTGRRRGPAVQTGKAPMPAVVGTGEHVVGGWDRLRSMANPGCAITVARVSLMDFFLFILL